MKGKTMLHFYETVDAVQCETTKACYLIFQRLIREPHLAIVASKNAVDETGKPIKACGKALEQEYTKKVFTYTGKNETVKLDLAIIKQPEHNTVSFTLPENLRVDADNVASIGEYQTTLPEFTCNCSKGLKLRKYSRKPCKACGCLPVRANAVKEKYLDKGKKTKDKTASVHPLYFAGNLDETDNFDRKYAIRYLTYRACFKQDESKGTDGKYSLKGTSQKHHYKYFNRSAIEDIAQIAFRIFWAKERLEVFNAKPFKQEAKAKALTRRACQYAMTEYLRDARKQQMVIDAVAFKASKMADKEQGKRNRDNLDDTLLDAVVSEGSATLEAMGNYFNISKQAMSKRLAKVRAEYVLG